MDKLLKKFLYCSCVSLLCAGALGAPAYGQDAEIFVIEAGADPTAFGGGPTVVDVTGALGGTIDLEIFVVATGALTPVRGAAADLPCVAEGGLSGAVEYVTGSGSISPFRDDFVFFQQVAQTPFDQSQCPGGNIRFGAALNAGDSDITGLGPKYFGQFSISISADACGTFTMPLIGGSGIVDVNSTSIPVFLRDLVIAAAPLNDACETATTGFGTFAYDTNCAATDGPGGCPADGDIWYSVTTNCAGILAAESAGAQIAIYSGSTCTPTDAEQAACANGRAEVLPVGPGEDFLIRLGSVGGGAISGDITISCSPFCADDSECTAQTDACNIGRCNPATGCFQEPANEGGSCDDGVFCTINDACSSGACVGDDNAGVGPCDDRNGCTIDSCPDGAATPEECVNASVNGEDGGLGIPCDVADPNDACALAGGNCVAGSCGECVSFLRPDLALDIVGGTDAGCAAVGDDGILTIEVNLGSVPGHEDRFPAAPLASGAQLFLVYDNAALDFQSIAPGGGVFVFQLFESVDEAAGTIDYAVGVNPANPAGSASSGRVAVIQFRVIDSAACSAGGVSFREHNPPTRLGATDGTELIPRQQKIDCVLNGDCVNPIGVSATCFDGYCTFDEDFDSVTNTFFEPLNAKDIGIDDGPPVLNCPFEGTITVPSDCNTLSANVTWDTIIGSDSCDGDIVCVGLPEGLENGGDFGVGTHDFSCTATDSCGNTASCSFTIENTGSQSVEVDIEVSPSVADGIDRCFTFEVSECGDAGGGDTTVIEQILTLGAPANLRGHGTTTLVVEPGNWECIEVRDSQHSLGSTCLLECGDDGVFHASFKGSPEFNESCHWLINGNLNSDPVIDILDFIIWSGGVRSQASCDPFDIDADITGDGVVTSADFSFILINFFAADKAGCDAACSGGAGATAGGLAEVSVRELYNMGFTAEQIRRADVTRDGMVNMEDMAAYVNGDAPQTRKRGTGTRGQIGRR